MGQKTTKVSPFTGDGVSELHPSQPPRPSPAGGAGGAGGDGGDEAVKEEERKEVKEFSLTKKRKRWWTRLTTFFRAARKQPAESSSIQQQQPETSTRRLAWAARSSDDYIFSHYSVGDQLGAGGFGVVYEGVRLDDGLQVALKYASKTLQTDTLFIPGHPKPLPKEIALTILANKGPSVPHIIRLLDWQDHPDHYVMILERPSPCQSLGDFLRCHGGRLDEQSTRQIMRQVVHAANVCCARGVLHRDIKLDNLLINTETSQVKLIDFGCGDVLRILPYRSYCGTMVYAPPEYRLKRRYFGRPATVWSLGVLMFAMLNGRFPHEYDLAMLKNNLWSKPGLSKECCQLLRGLLQVNQSRRLGLGRISSHKWFKVTT